jgi:small GTP-binding protein
MKIVVTGPIQCGKSSYINYLDKKSLNVQVRGQDNKYYTVALDLASLKINGFDIFLFGTPGLLRFRVMRDVVCRGADGFIFIFDAVDAEKDKDAISILNSIRGLSQPNIPIVFLANKQDLEGAREPEMIKTQNNLPESSKILPSSTITGLNIKESIHYLVNTIFENYKEMLQILQNYETDIKGLAEKLHKDKLEMRDFLNNLEVKRFIEIDRAKKTYHVKEGLKKIIS